MWIANRKFIIQKLYSRREIDVNGCWLYTGSLSQGYGNIQYLGKLWRVHRLATLIWHETFDINAVYCHKNLVCKSRACFNPEHVYKGTYTTNNKDARDLYTYIAGDKHNSLKVKCPQGHEYTKENTYYINTSKTKSRQCKICRKLRYLLKAK